MRKKGKFGRNLTEIWQKFGKNLAEIWVKNKKKIQKISKTARKS